MDVASIPSHLLTASQSIAVASSLGVLILLTFVPPSGLALRVPKPAALRRRRSWAAVAALPTWSGRAAQSPFCCVLVPSTDGLQPYSHIRHGMPCARPSSVLATS